MNAQVKSNPATAILETLASAYAVFRDGQPLAIGIHKEIKQRMPTLTDADLRPALYRHVISTKYLKALANGDTRFDLDGNPAGEVTPEQRQIALISLKERIRKVGDRKRAEQQIKEHQEKLQKLAEKFNRK